MSYHVTYYYLIEQGEEKESFYFSKRVKSYANFSKLENMYPFFENMLYKIDKCNSDVVF